MPGVERPIVVTMGEPAGVGAELLIKSWHRKRADGPAFVAIDDPERLTSAADILELVTPIQAVANCAAGAANFANALPVLVEPLAVPPTPGIPNSENAPTVIRSIERAVELVRKGAASAVVTNPIHKKCLYESGFAFPGHTEFLGALAGLDQPPVMMLAAPGLRVVPVTVHVALAEVPARLTSDAIVHAGSVTARALREDFGIAAPRLAVAGLNPHAGEAGSLGREDIEIIAPAIASLTELGVDSFGPAPADTLFHEAARANYDAALCMYHDQALIPLKTLDFFAGVNVTLGLPFIRTSPDHGVALDIAGAGTADPASLLAAIRMAAELSTRRASSTSNE